MPKPENTYPLQRAILGVLAIICFLASGVLHYVGNDTMSPVLLRVSLIFFAFWLAMPQLNNVPRWLLIAALASFLIMSRWKQVLIPACVVAAAWLFLRPRLAALGRSADRSSKPRKKNPEPNPAQKK